MKPVKFVADWAAFLVAILLRLLLYDIPLEQVKPRWTPAQKSGQAVAAIDSCLLGQPW